VGFDTFHKPSGSRSGRLTPTGKNGPTVLIYNLLRPILRFWRGFIIFRAVSFTIFRTKKVTSLINYKIVSSRSPYHFYLLTAGVDVVYFQWITLRHTTVGRTPLDEGSARQRDLYLTTQTLTRNTHDTSGIRIHDPSKRSAAADPRLRPRGHWDRH
jgi:hypothetical protein